MSKALRDELAMAVLIDLKFPWLDRAAGTQGVEEVRVFARHQRARYGRFRFENRAVAPNEAYAKATAFSARSRIAFMDSTGLLSSKTANSCAALTGRDMWPGGFTYTVTWMCPVAKRLLITTEPDERHLPLVQSECSARGWPYHVFAPGMGMRNPPNTRLVLASPQGIDIAPLVQILNRALPTTETRKETQ
jgi:hypothetical protein